MKLGAREGWDDRKHRSLVGFILGVAVVRDGPVVGVLEDLWVDTKVGSTVGEADGLAQLAESIMMMPSIANIGPVELPAPMVMDV